MQGNSQESEHNFRRIIQGHIDAVRAGLCTALEQLDYGVLTENPIHAKRSQQKSLLSANVLEYGSKLTIGLKSISPTSTMATFDYTVHLFVSQGDRLALEREGEALIALAMAPTQAAYCPACGAENGGDVRFCRACGAPIAKDTVTTEIDLMHLTAQASGSYIEVGWGLGILFLTLLASLLLFFLGDPKRVNFGKGLLVIGSAISFFFLLGGFLRLRATLKRPAVAQPEPHPSQTRALPMRNTPALPGRPASITEGTTELINAAPPVPVSARVRDTDSME